MVTKNHKTHKMKNRHLLPFAICCLFVLLGLAPIGQAQDIADDARLPEGNQGIAQRYPGDVGIADDDHVIFVEDFDEENLQAIFDRWENINHGNQMSLSEDTPLGEESGHSMLMTHLGGGPDTVSLYRRLPEGHTVLFARFYVKFDSSCSPIHHMGTALGGFNPSTRWPPGRRGRTARR